MRNSAVSLAALNQNLVQFDIHRHKKTVSVRPINSPHWNKDLYSPGGPDCGLVHEIKSKTRSRGAAGRMAWVSKTVSLRRAPKAARNSTMRLKHAVIASLKDAYFAEKKLTPSDVMLVISA
jgi:hypothetical protein